MNPISILTRAGVCLGLLAAVARAEDLYVRAGAAGSRTGADWNNAWNSFSDVKWGDGAGRVGPGDTLWIAGGTYTSALVVGASGTASSPISIKRVRASDAVPAAAAGWNSNFDSQVVINTSGSCIYLNNGLGSYLTIDGRVKSGIKVNYQNGGRGVEMNGGANFTNTTFRYIDAAGPGPITQIGDTRGFDLTTQGMLTNLTVSHCEAHHSDTLMQVSQSTNLVIEYCDLHHAGAINAATYHPNTIYLATVKNATIRHNIMREIDVEGLFFGDGGNDGAYIYGNLFYQGSSPKNSGRGIEFDNSADTKNVLIYNNTFVDLPLFGVSFNNGRTHTGAVVRNNIFFNTSANFGPAAHDYNYFSGSNQGEPNGIANGASPFVNAAAYDYHIVSTIASNKPRNEGVNLGSTYATDRDGNVRGADGAWDIGAYEYPSSGAPANTPPTIASIANQTTTSGGTVGPLSFLVADTQTAAGSLTLSATSSNATLVPNSGIAFGGSGSNRTVTVKPAAGQSGTSTITVTVSDGTASASTSFTVTVTASAPVYTAPTITSIANQTITSGGTVGPVSFTVGDAQTSAGSLTLSATSSNTTLVPTSAVTFGGSGANRTVTVKPASGQTGTSTIKITVSDGTASASASFTVTVNATAPANTPPTITSIANQTITSGGTVGPVSFTIGDAQTSAGNLKLTATSSNTTLVPTSAVTFGGSGANRTVTVKPASGRTGTSTIKITVSDGTASASASFTVTVNATAPANTPPTITSIANQTITSGGTVGPVSFTIGDAQTSAGNLKLTATSSNTTLVPTSAVTFGGSGANRTVTVKPASGRTGTSTIKITVSDGTASASASFTVTVNATAPVNTAPTISSIATQSTQVGVAVGPIAFTVGDAQTAAGSLTLSATSSNTTLVPTSAVTFGGSGANRTVTVKPAASQSGTATITVKVSDGAAQASTSFVLTVSAPAKPASGLVAAYAFNETSGTTAGDASGNGNAGAVTDATWSSAGKFGGALVFNGSSSLVYVKPSASLNLGAKMTLSAWVKPTATQSGWRTIVQKQVDSYFLHASSNSAMKPAAGGTFGGKKAWATSPTALTVGAWTHLAVSYDGANVRLFINGRQVASQAQTGAIESNGNGLRIGGTVPYGEYFKGLIDEVRVYNRSLSESEIRADMNAPIAAAAAADTDAPLQNVWSETSVGKVGLTGSESSDERTATLTVKGAGTEIGGNADAFHFVYRPLQGDGVVETRIDSVAASHGGAKAGVMIRESLAPGARNVFLGLTPKNGARLQSRVWAGGATNAITAPNLSPYWVRLERSGSTVVASISADGTHWTEVKKVWIPMAKNAYIGFAVTSRDTQKLATAVFGEPFIE